MADGLYFGDWVISFLHLFLICETYRDRPQLFMPLIQQVFLGQSLYLAVHRLNVKVFSVKLKNEVQN